MLTIQFITPHLFVSLKKNSALYIRPGVHGVEIPDNSGMIVYSSF